MRSGNLNFLEPSGPLQAYYGTALPLPFMYLIKYTKVHTDYLQQFLPHTELISRDDCRLNIESS